MVRDFNHIKRSNPSKAPAAWKKSFTMFVDQHNQKKALAEIEERRNAATKLAKKAAKKADKKQRDDMFRGFGYGLIGASALGAVFAVYKSSQTKANRVEEPLL